MNEERILTLTQKLNAITAAREPVEAIFAALKKFEGQTRRHNRRHLVTPSPSAEEWSDIYNDVEPYAWDLARALEAHRDLFSQNLTTVLDAAAGLIDEAPTLGIDPLSILRQFSFQTALKAIERVPSKLNVFLYSWGRPSLERYQGEQMRHAIVHASSIEREASYFASYFSRLLDRGSIYDTSSDG